MTAIDIQWFSMFKFTIPETLASLGRMYQLKEQLREVVEGSGNWGMGTLSLVDWLVEAQ